MPDLLAAAVILALAIYAWHDVRAEQRRAAALAGRTRRLAHRVNRMRGIADDSAGRPRPPPHHTGGRR